jgi:hypothetical protein
MEWLVYENTDSSTQIFVGVILITSIIVLVGLNIYYWLKNLNKNK